MNQIDSKREKGKMSILDPKGHLLPWKPVVGSSKISNSYKLSCMLSLPASTKRIQSRTAEKEWRHPVSHYKPMGIFSDVQGQLTPQSEVQSGQNSNSSELSYMSLLPATMGKNGSKTAQK